MTFFNQKLFLFPHISLFDDSYPMIFTKIVKNKIKNKIHLHKWYPVGTSLHAQQN